MFKRIVFPVFILLLISTACGGLTLPQTGSSSSVQATTDASRTVTGTIGAGGGTLKTTSADGTAYELIAPAEALDFDETISMTPVSSMDGLPLSGGLAGGVTLEPAGIIFYEPAILRITPAAPLSSELAVGFAYDGMGEELHLQRLVKETSSTGMVPVAPFLFNAIAPVANVHASSPTLQLSVPSTRGYGVGLGTQKDVARRQKAPRPSDPMDNIDELILPLTPDLRLPVMGETQFVEAMSKTFNADILPLLKAAETDPSLAEKALHIRPLAGVCE